MCLGQNATEPQSPSSGQEGATSQECTLLPSVLRQPGLDTETLS